MTPEEIAQEEEKKRAFKQWAGGMFENMQYGGAPHFNPQTGQYVRNQGGLSVTKVQRLPERPAPDAPPMERPLTPDDPNSQGRPAPEYTPAPVTPQELEPSQPSNPAPSEPEPAPDEAAPAPEGEDKEQASQANQKANRSFQNYMKLFGSPRRR
jgi:hypothetical protein